MSRIIQRTQMPLAKVLITGASNAGKTSLVNSFIFTGFFDVSPTIGIDFAQKICVGEAGPLNLSIWDLSGQSRFRFLMPRLCEGASGVVLVFDQTNYASLQMAEDWLEFLLSYNQPTLQDAVVLAGTKADLPSSIPHSEIKAFCTKHNITDYIPCSAKSGHNVKLVFEKLCAAIQQHPTEPTVALEFPQIRQL